MIPSILSEKLGQFGVVTLRILCKQVENKIDLKNKFNIGNNEHCELLWKLVTIQRYPMQYHDDQQQQNVIYDDQQEGINNNVDNNVVDTAQ